jgi:capsular polysaccharide biosynthesis protein
MVYPHQNPGPEHAEAAHPKVENIHYVETAAVLEDAKVAKKLRRGLVVAVVAIVAAVTLLFLLLYVA